MPEPLPTISSTVRRPPELQFFRDISEENAPLDAIMLGEIEPTLNGGTLDMAYAIAEFVVRREAEVSASCDPSAQEGHALMADLARMMEFLFITSPNSGVS
ncbi:hypothetical protein AAD018_001460 [Aestuariibius insulae]|uniref:hypothetical protein n=1 Tax=Aestuariibius insulae TaxID=2058287 RepID=UPI00398EACEA